MKKYLLLILCACLMVACGGHNGKKTIKVAATSIPHAEMLQVIKSDLQNEGIELQILEIDDYNLPNRLLDEKEVDANFFQHLPFLKAAEKEYGDRLSVLASIHYEPLGLYSVKITSLNEVKYGMVISIPSDPSNESRALRLLADIGMIGLKNSIGEMLTVNDIDKNPRTFSFCEIDAPLLTRLIEDVDIAVIPANFALQANLEEKHPPLAIEGSDDYPNVLVIRKGEEGREELQILKKYLTSEKMRHFLLHKYKGAVQPLF